MTCWGCRPEASDFGNEVPDGIGRSRHGAPMLSYYRKGCMGAASDWLMAVNPHVMCVI
jgi:hypothetical protein